MSSAIGPPLNGWLSTRAAIAYSNYVDIYPPVLYIYIYIYIYIYMYVCMYVLNNQLQWGHGAISFSFFSFT